MPDTIDYLLMINDYWGWGMVRFTIQKGIATAKINKKLRK